MSIFPLVLLGAATALQVAGPTPGPGLPGMAALREVAADDIRAGLVQASPARVWVVHGRYLRWLPAAASPSDDLQAGASTVRPGAADRLGPYLRQCEVEATRRARSTPAERAFWGPVLARVEAIIARDLAAVGPADPGRQDRSDREIDAIYEEAIRGYAATIGVRYVSFDPRPRPGSTPTELRQLAANCLGSGYVEFTPPNVEMSPAGLVYRPARAVVPPSPAGDRPVMPPPQSLIRRCEVEGIRRDRASPAERAFWGPILARVEPVIDRMLAVEGAGEPPDFAEIFRLDRDVSDLYEGAIRDYAARLGVAVVPPVFVAPMAPSKVASQESVRVTLSTPSGRGTIYLAHWLDWRLAYFGAIHEKKPVGNEIFDAIAPGTEQVLLGIYAYRIEDPPGRLTEVKRVSIFLPGKLILAP